MAEARVAKEDAEQPLSKVPAVSLSLMFFVAFCCGARGAEADPIRVTSGYVEAGFGRLGEPWNAEAVSLFGAGFHIQSSLEDEVAFVQLDNLATFDPGGLVDFSGVLRVADVVGAQLNDSFALVTAPFTMSFVASPARLACSGDGSIMRCIGVAPFRFDAELTFIPLNGSPVTHHLVGGGTVEGMLTRSAAFGESGGVRYAFEPSPVPEPATLSLFTAGAFAAAAGVWRRRRASRTDSARLHVSG